MQTSNPETSDYLVVGGGVVGMMLARNLALAGAAVTLVERGECGMEASWAGGGIVSPLYPWRYPDAVTRLANWSQAHYRDLARSLSGQTGCDVEYAETGLLILQVEDRASALDWAATHGVRLEALDRRSLDDLQPGVARHWQGGWWMPGVASVRNPRLARALRIGLQKDPRVQLVERTSVTGLLRQSGVVTGVCTSATEFHAEKTVICGGAWSAKLLETVDYSLPVVPVRGQMLIHQPAPGLLRRVILAEGRYLIPRLDGRILVGSTLEYEGFSKQVTEEAHQSLLRSAVRLLPALKRVPVEAHWCGLRPGSRDGIPVMGAVPGLQGLHVCAGHFRNGLVLAPASARFMADVLLGNNAAFPEAPYAPPEDGWHAESHGVSLA